MNCFSEFLYLWPPEYCGLWIIYVLKPEQRDKLLSFIFDNNLSSPKLMYWDVLRSQPFNYWLIRQMAKKKHPWFVCHLMTLSSLLLFCCCCLWTALPADVWKMYIVNLTPTNAWKASGYKRELPHWLQRSQ